MPWVPSVKVLGTGVPSNLANIPAIPATRISIRRSYGANTAPLVDAATAGDAFACTTLAAGSLNGAIALVQRGPTGDSACTFDVKAANAQDAGAVGMIVFMSADSPPLTPVPSPSRVSISSSDRWWAFPMRMALHLRTTWRPTRA